MLSLKVEIRDPKDKPDSVRKAGKVPAVFYGRKEPSTPITIGRKDFLKIWKDAGESSVISLETPKGKVESLIHEIQFDPVSGEPQHADFYVFEKGHKVRVEVPLEFTGVSPAIKDLGGTLVKVVHDLEVEAEPQNLPHAIEVDISPLTSFESQILIRDIALPAGVTVLKHPEEVVALVSEPREEKEEEAAPIDLSQIEVEKKGKEEEAEAGEASAEDKEEKTQE